MFVLSIIKNAKYLFHQNLFCISIVIFFFNLINGSPSWLLVDDIGYEYKHSHTNVDNTVIWRCTNGEFPKCPGKVTTIGYKKPITQKSEHEHVTTIKKKVKEVVGNIRAKAATNPDSKPRKIILENMKNLDKEIVANMPTYKATRQVCSRARIDEYENYEIPSDLNFVLPENFKTINSGNSNELF
ncbi:unnamed protein product [Brachionus calyciflorus]|uniref:FLYWCH-type domain-containing protein n=1 Tax=Brachionus calyciflorus TaxID=104777 RepID=A0A813US93_9BILA|nr:unnamed protein product [Brachionus calyciflorus]